MRIYGKAHRIIKQQICKLEPLYTVTREPCLADAKLTFSIHS